MYWLVARVLWNETAFPSVMPRTAAETRTVDSLPSVTDDDSHMISHG